MVTDTEIERAVEVLRAGGLVAFPTETVYGLGADAADPAALHRLYAVKRRPRSHPVIVHIAAAAALDRWAAAVPVVAWTLAEACWPGPLTLVLPRTERVPDEVTGGRGTVGLRVPDHPLALRLLRRFDGGIAAPSANRFGRVSPTRADDVRADLGADVDVVLDGGPCTIGVESTIVAFSDGGGTAEPVILRPGGVATERVEELAGRPVPVRQGATGGAPGTLPSHYSPRARVVLVGAADVTERAARELASGRRVGVLGEKRPDNLPAGVVVLESPRDADEYARVLYARLRAADDAGLEVVLAVAPAEVGVGTAVADRLRRAAGARS
ncbi:MAG: L-threonylcarbamoyladenylate synthase [Acidimicrobiia bacterium]